MLTRQKASICEIGLGEEGNGVDVPDFQGSKSPKNEGLTLMTMRKQGPAPCASLASHFSCLRLARLATVEEK